MHTSQKVALITGSTSGIGLGVAKRLAQAQYRVILNGMDEEKNIDPILLDLKAKNNIEAMYFRGDLTQIEVIEDLIKTIHKNYGRLDVVVNNAGIQFVSPIENFPIEKWDKILALNLSTPFHLARLSIPFMKEQGWGRIINIASAHALVASPFKSAYVSAKHGLAGLTKAIALEVATHGITCNAICPGYVLTPLVEGQIDSTAAARGISRESVINDVMLGEQSTKKFVGIDEVAGLAAFLCNDDAKSINGALLAVDGGWTAH